MAEKRLKALNAFLKGVLAMPSTVSCSDLVYAFFHRTPRDVHDQMTVREGVQVRRCGLPNVLTRTLQDAGSPAFELGQSLA